MATLTKARAKALAVLAAAADAGRLVRVSNYTSEPAAIQSGVHQPAVYWKTADWLVENGLAAPPFSPPMGIAITAAGREALGVRS